MSDKILNGISWNSVAVFSKQGLNVLLTIILANLLTPQVFGVFATLSIFSGYALVLVNFGFRSAIIQDRDIPESTLSTIFWLNVVIGISLVIIVNLFAGLIASFYSEPSLKPLLKVVSITFFLGSLSIVHLSLLQKRLEFKTIAICEIIPIVFSGLIAIGYAYFKPEIWAMVFQVLFYNIFVNLLVWKFSPWRPKFHFKISELKPYVNYVSSIFFNNSLKYATDNLDFLLVGKKFGQSSLGIYRNALLFINLPGAIISSVLSKVFFPLFSKHSDDDEYISHYFLKLNRLVSFFTFPCMLLLFVNAESFIEILLGEKWDRVLPYLQIFVFAGMFRSLNALVGSVYLSKGNSSIIWKVGLIKKGVIISSVIIGASIDLWWLAILRTLAEVLNLIISFYFIKLSIGLKMKRQFLNITRNLIISFFMMFLLLALKKSLILPDILSISLSLIAGTLIYLTAQRVFNPMSFQESFSYIKKLLKIE